MGLTDSEAKVETNVTDIDLSATKKKQFRINGDNNLILELNTSDLSVLSRLNKLYPKLQKLAGEAVSEMLPDEDVEGEEYIQKSAEVLENIDKEMREALDTLFDSNVSEVCAPYGTMYDPIGGKFRYEHIIEVLTGLYEDNLKNEMKLAQKRISKHTDKYTKKKKN